jgi:hypothetical protein
MPASPCPANPTGKCPNQNTTANKLCPPAPHSHGQEPSHGHGADGSSGGGAQAYAHVKASMVKLPFAAAVGRDSLLQTLVESDVPVQAFGTPSIRAVIRYKWQQYAQAKLLLRAACYCVYTAAFTLWAVLLAMVGGWA